MQPDIASPGARSQRRTRAPGERLRAALAELAGAQAVFTAHSERRWASITFAGARHRFVLSFAGEAGCEAGEAFIAALPDHEFAIPGQLVADADIVEVDHHIAPDMRMTVTAELLLLEDA